MHDNSCDASMLFAHPCDTALQMNAFFLFITFIACVYNIIKHYSVANHGQI